MASYIFVGLLVTLLVYVM